MKSIFKVAVAMCVFAFSSLNAQQVPEIKWYASVIAKKSTIVYSSSLLTRQGDSTFFWTGLFDIQDGIFADDPTMKGKNEYNRKTDKYRSLHIITYDENSHPIEDINEISKWYEPVPDSNMRSLIDNIPVFQKLTKILTLLGRTGWNELDDTTLIYKWLSKSECFAYMDTPECRILLEMKPTSSGLLSKQLGWVDFGDSGILRTTPFADFKRDVPKEIETLLLQHRPTK